MDLCLMSSFSSLISYQNAQFLRSKEHSPMLVALYICLPVGEKGLCTLIVDKGYSFAHADARFNSL